MFKSTFPEVQPKAVKIGERLQTTMNNTAETQETRKLRINRFKKTTTQEGSMNTDLKTMITDINEAETLLIMALAQMADNSKFATNTMGAIQDVLMQIIETVKPLTDDIVVIVNEYNAISMEIAGVAYLNLREYFKFLPAMGAADLKIEPFTKCQLDKLLQMAEAQVTLMDCSPEAAEVIIKGALKIIGKIKMLAPRIVKLQNSFTVLQNKMVEGFSGIKVDPYYAGNAFDQK